MLECKCVISIVDNTNLEEERSKSNLVKFERGMQRAFNVA
jgi:hypothetical protein